MVIIVCHVSIRRVWFLLLPHCHLHFRKAGGRKEGGSSCGVKTDNVRSERYLHLKVKAEHD